MHRWVHKVGSGCERDSGVLALRHDSTEQALRRVLALGLGRQADSCELKEATSCIQLLSDIQDLLPPQFNW